MLKRINGINLSYRDQGSGIPVVFLHAFPLNQAMWDPQLAKLQTCCRTITVDLRGFGKSDAPPGPYSMDQMAADVHGLMSALDIDRAVLVGLSMGGYIALTFCRNYPDSVRALVLADTRANVDKPEARERRLASAERVVRDGVKAIADDMIPLLLGLTTMKSRPSIVNGVRKLIELNSPIGLAGAQLGMAERRDSTQLLREISVPVLIIVGSEDKLIPVSEAEVLRDSISGSVLRVIELAGHLSSIEQPDVFNTVLIEFLERLPRQELK